MKRLGAWRKKTPSLYNDPLKPGAQVRCRYAIFGGHADGRLEHVDLVPVADAWGWAEAAPIWTHLGSFTRFKIENWSKLKGIKGI